MKTLNKTFDPNRAVRILNAHHLATSAGFYGSVIGGRWFKARALNGELQINNFDFWRSVTEAEAVFHDHNGNQIDL